MDDGQVLERTGHRAKDEMAQVIEVYVQAETGVRDMQRMVLSGHSVGDQIWGDSNGDLDFSLFEELASILPRSTAKATSCPSS